MLQVGNGYLATVVSWGSLHVGGLFNGACGTTTKARFPSPVALSVLGGTVSVGGLDMMVREAELLCNVALSTVHVVSYG